MKKIVAILSMLAGIIELFLTNDITSLVLAMIILYLLYGKDIMIWYMRLILKKQ